VVNDHEFLLYRPDVFLHLIEAVASARDTVHIAEIPLQETVLQKKKIVHISHLCTQDKHENVTRKTTNEEAIGRPRRILNGNIEMDLN
jgi:hypothetical protein